MLGFRSSKCKTSCKLCVSRIKLLRNKREIQQRRHVGQLLKEGKNEYAWIRVEGIIREQNLLAAYEILELYLELIAVRVELLDKSKNCPRDMVEAITTIMYAAPRVADLPELIEVRKWLSIKYGRELGVEGGRNFDGNEPPNWQVNLRLRQYLGVEAPEAEDKLTVISSIAQENEVEFDLESYAQSVMVQYDSAVLGIPPIPEPPKFQTTLAANNAQPLPAPTRPTPVRTQGNVPPSIIPPTSPSTHEPTSDGPVLPPAQPSFRVPFTGPSTGPYTDAQFKMTGKTFPADDCADDTTAPAPDVSGQKSFNTLQQQYDDIPSPPKKEAFHEEAEDESSAVMPTAPPGSDESPSEFPLPPSNYPIDDDLSRRLSELRKR